MKSIKEKAEAYDKVLEWATEAHKVCDGMLKEDLEHLFPELKESEDERIRKRIIQALHGDVLEMSEIKEAVDWLENQGKHSNFLSKIEVGDKVTRNEDGILVNLSKLNRVAKKQGEQKPVDKKGMNLVEEEMTPFQKEVFCIIDTAIEEEQGLKQVCDKLFALASNEIKQKPAWSEEDELMLISTTQSLKLTNGAAQMKIDWLKSLKERYTWKPSDEQIDALDFAANCIVPAEFCFKRKALKELLEQLKKLREE